MNKFTLWPLSLSLMLAACAPLEPGPEADTAQPREAPAQTRDAPARAKAPAAQATVDWPHLRGRIMASLETVPGITLRTDDAGALHIDIPSAEGFLRDSDAIQPALTTALDRIAPRLADHARTSVQVVGHTDSMGSELYNLRLSIRRAEAVMEYLRGRGIALVRLSADGKGEGEPIADNASPTERIKNRRVELVIRPLEQ